MCNENECQDIFQVVFLKNRVEVLAVFSLRYLVPLHWPTHRTIAREAMVYLDSAWPCLPNSFRDGFQMQNDMCPFCGWLTGNGFNTTPQCFECDNDNICDQCTYQVPGKGRRCFECDLINDLVHSDVVVMKGLLNHLRDSFNVFHSRGAFHSRYMLPKLAFRSWKLDHQRTKEEERQYVSECREFFD